MARLPYNSINKKDKSRQIATNHDSTSSVLRNFAVAKVLPLDHTIKKSFIVSRSLKRNFAVALE
jgi:hypothetical protein